MFYFFKWYKLSDYYFWSNRKELLKKAHDKYRNKGGKEKVAEYYQKCKEMVKQRERNNYKWMNTSEKNKIRKRSLDRYYKSKAQYKE